MSSSSFTLFPPPLLLLLHFKIFTSFALFILHPFSSVILQLNFSPSLLYSKNNKKMVFFSFHLFMSTFLDFKTFFEKQTAVQVKKKKKRKMRTEQKYCELIEGRINSFFFFCFLFIYRFQNPSKKRFLFLPNFTDDNCLP